jgi:hypothetical protein
MVVTKVQLTPTPTPTVSPTPTPTPTPTPAPTNSPFAGSAFPVAPVVSGVTPSSGPAAGGTQVGIAGTGFTGTNGVFFGATPTRFVVLSDNSIVAISPPGTGTVDVRVTTPFGTSASQTLGRFTYLTSQILQVPAAVTSGPTVVTNQNSSSSTSSASASASGGAAPSPAPAVPKPATTSTLVRTGVDALPLAAFSLALIALGLVLLRSPGALRRRPQDSRS